MIWNRRLKSGYSDLGPIRIPPLGGAIVLTDRTDGTKWLVSFSTDPIERLSIVSSFDTIQRREGVREYEADDGPKMDEDGQFTIIIRNGRIGLDFIPFIGDEVARDDAPPYSRTASQQRALIIDTIDPITAHIGYEI